MDRAPLRQTDQLKYMTEEQQWRLLHDRLHKQQPSIGIVEWWYQRTAPPLPPSSASLAEREHARRGRLTSIVLFVTTFFAGLGTIAIIASHNPYTITSHAISMVMNIAALYLNRHGKVNLAGSLAVFSMGLSVTVAIISAGTVGLNNLLAFELLTLPQLLAVALLPPIATVIVTVYNCLLVWCDLTYFPHSAELEKILATSRFFFIVAPIVLYVIVAVVTSLFASNTLAAIKRADLAQELAALEQRERERQEQEIEQRRQLELGIQQILQTHVQVANGNFNARAPLTQENVLWQIGYSLNNLLARLQSYSRIESELKQANAQSTQMLEAVRKAKRERKPITIERGGTFLDPLTLELNGQFIAQPPRLTHPPVSGPLHSSLDGQRVPDAAPLFRSVSSMQGKKP